MGGDKEQFPAEILDKIEIVNREFPELYRDILAYYSQFNFGTRMTEEDYEMIKSLPATIYSSNGICITHAGPGAGFWRKPGAKSVKEVVTDSIQDLVNPREDILHQINWGRPPVDQYATFSVNQLLQFLEAINASVLVTGHTGIDNFPSNYQGAALVGLSPDEKGMIVIAPSDGALPEFPSYLEIDLSKPHTKLSDFIDYGELRVRQSPTGNLGSIDLSSFAEPDISRRGALLHILAYFKDVLDSAIL